MVGSHDRRTQRSLRQRLQGDEQSTLRRRNHPDRNQTLRATRPVCRRLGHSRLHPRRTHLLALPTVTDAWKCEPTRCPLRLGCLPEHTHRHPQRFVHERLLRGHAGHDALGAQHRRRAERGDVGAHDARANDMDALGGL